MPYYKTESSKQITIDQIEAPNSSIYVDYRLNNLDCSDNNYKLLKENITLLNDCLGIKDNSNNMLKTITLIFDLTLCFQGAPGAADLPSHNSFYNNLMNYLN